MKNIVRIFSFVTASAIIIATSILTVSLKSQKATEQNFQKALVESSGIDSAAVNSEENSDSDIIISEKATSSNITEKSKVEKQEINNTPAKANSSSSVTKRTDTATDKVAGSSSPTLGGNYKFHTGTSSSGSVTTPSKPNTVPNTTQKNTNTTVSAYETEVVELVNNIRISNGLKPFTINEELCNVARIKSQDMHDKGYFSHTSPTYGSPFDMMKQFGISYKTAGENIAMGYTSPKAVVDGWMNSEGHRANIMNASFTQIGVGYVSSGNYWTQMFIG